MQLTKEFTARGSVGRIGVAIGLVAVISVVGLWLLVTPDGKLQREQMAGETPPAKVEAYVAALAHGDEAAALNLWELPSLRDQAQLSALAERRGQVTAALLASRRGAAFTIVRTEWWGTCCEPRVIGDARDAGGARMRVQFTNVRGMPPVYVFDVFVRDLPYWGAAMDYPLRQWVIRDVYPEGQAPLYWRLTGGSTPAP